MEILDLPDNIKELLDTINKKQLDDFWLGLNHNINAIKLLKTNPHKISWLRLVTNPNSFDIIENNLEYFCTKIGWEYISANPGLSKIIKNNLDKVDWYWVSTNESCIDVLQENYDKINWNGLTFNKNAINILENNLDKININELIFNENIFKSTKIIDYLENNIHEIQLMLLIENKNIGKLRKILNLLKNKNILFDIYFIILNDPDNAFNSDIVYNYLLQNYNIINWTKILNYDEFFKSNKMIELLDTIFNLNNFTNIPNNLWYGLLKNPNTIIVSNLYNILIKNKININYYYLGINPNLFY